MHPLLYKIKNIFLPFLLISVLYIALYALLDWLLFVKLSVLLPYQEMIETFAPLLLSIVVYGLLLRRPLRRYRNKSLGMMFIFGAVGTVFFPLAMITEWVKDVTGNVSELTVPSQISKRPLTVFYRFNNYYVDKSKAYCTFHTSLRTRSSGNSHEKVLDLYECYDVPVFDSAQDTIARKPEVRMTFEYKNSMNAHLSQSKKDRRIADFRAENKANFQNKDVSHYDYFNGERNKSIQVQYQKQLREQPGATTLPNYYLQGAKGDIASNNNHFITSISKVYSFCAIIYLLLTLIPGVDEKYLRR